MEPVKLYMCEACGDEFESDRNDQDAQQEFVDNHGNDCTDDEKAVICEDCYQTYIAWFQKSKN